MSTTSIAQDIFLIGLSSIEIFPEQALDEELLFSVLKDRKSAKLLSKQDKLALICATRAFKQSLVSDRDPQYSERTGIYFTSGILPFEDAPLDKLAQNSQIDHQFDPVAFSTTGFESMNPLLTFKCLPNMPLFHISMNLGIRGPYMMSYPGISEFFMTLEKALRDLSLKKIKYALVGATSDQNNFLVKNFKERIKDDGVAFDSGVCMVLTTDQVSTALGKLENFSPPQRRRDNRQYAPPTLPLISLAKQFMANQEEYSFSWDDDNNKCLCFSTRGFK